MNNSEKQQIHTLFETENYSELYLVQTEVVQKMLSLDSQEEFEDFLAQEDCIEEEVFWLHYAAAHGDGLLIDGYEGDITRKVSDFLRQKLSEEIFGMVQNHLHGLYVDIDAEDNLEQKIDLCNQCLADTDYLIQIIFDDTYYARVYFLSVINRADRS